MLKTIFDALFLPKDSYAPSVAKQRNGKELSRALQNGALLDGTVISGGQAAERTLPLQALLRQAQASGLPCVVLHSGSPSINLNSPYVMQALYDPLLGTTPDVAALVLSEGAGIYDSIAEASLFLPLSGLMQVAYGKGCCGMAQLMDLPAREQIANAILAGFDLEDDISALFTGENLNALTLFLAKLNATFPWLRTDSHCQYTQSIGGFLSSRSSSEFTLQDESSVLSLNLSRDPAVWSYAFAELSHLGSAGPFCLILDSPPTLHHMNGRTAATLFAYLPDSFAVSCADAPTLFGEAWPNLMERASCSISYRHGSGKSAKTLSDYFGECDRVYVESSSGFSNQQFSLMSTTKSSSAQIRYARGHQIEPETLQALPYGTAVVQLANGARQLVRF